MKTCMIWGDMMSDKASEQYPSVAVCDECVAEYSGKDKAILTVSDYDPVSGNACQFCDTTLEEEQEAAKG